MLVRSEKWVDCTGMFVSGPHSTTSTTLASTAMTSAVAKLENVLDSVALAGLAVEEAKTIQMTPHAVMALLVVQELTAACGLFKKPHRQPPTAICACPFRQKLQYHGERAFSGRGRGNVGTVFVDALSSHKANTSAHGSIQGSEPAKSDFYPRRFCGIPTRRRVPRNRAGIGGGPQAIFFFFFFCL